MWLIRTLLLIAEWGGLLLSVAGALVAYLLNLHQIDLPKKSHLPFKQIWLKNWVEFRKKQENKSPFFDFLTSALTIGAAATFVPLISRLPGLLRDLWHVAIANYPYETIRIGVMVFLFALAWLLFFLRRHSPRLYAFCEIAIGFAMAWDALAFVAAAAVPDGQASAYWAGKVFSPNALKVMAAVYVIIRGLVNWNEKSKYSLLPAGKPQQLASASAAAAPLQLSPAQQPNAPVAQTRAPSANRKGKKRKH